MLQKALKVLVTIPWLLLIFALIITWDVKTRFGINGILIPYLILLLSLFVFNDVPPLFRHIHHGLVVPTLLISLATSYFFIFHGGEQSGVGAYLVTYGAIAGYLVFISLFLIVLTIRKYRGVS
ncbi:MAG: hypothetical protein ACKE9I_03735 [Methylophagaceae bacterium]